MQLCSRHGQGSGHEGSEDYSGASRVAYLAHHKAYSLVVGLRLQPLLGSHVGDDLEKLKEKEASRPLLQRDLELPVAAPNVFSSLDWRGGGYRTTRRFLMAKSIPRATSGPAVMESRPERVESIRRYRPSISIVSRWSCAQ